MKVQDLRELETAELNNKVEEFKKELFGLRFQQATGQLENTARIKEVRKSIAKIKTVIRERELNKEERLWKEIIVRFILEQLSLLKWIRL